MARLLKTWRRPSHEPPSVEREFSWEREEVEKRQRGGDLFCFKDVWFTCKLVTCIQRKSHTLMIPIQRYCFFFPNWAPEKAGNPADTQKKKRLIKKIPTWKCFFFWKPEAVPYAFQRCRELLLTKTYSILWNDLAVDGPAKVFFERLI